MNTLSETHLAYIAGLLDGEGRRCFCRKHAALAALEIAESRSYL